MWIITISDNPYPTVLHFDTEEEARVTYEKEYKGYDNASLAEVKETNLSKEDTKKYDVNWT